MLFLFKWLKKSNPANMPCSAVIAAAGSSQRMDGADKLFLEVLGAPVLAHTLSAFQRCTLISEIVVVTRGDCLEAVAELCKDYDITKASKVIVGGESRLDSVFSGVFAVSDKAQLIAIHDGARPCVSGAIIESTAAAAAKHHAAAPGVPVSSTLKMVKNGVIVKTVDRGGLFEIQTPQVFSADLIKAALTNAKNKSIDITDDCGAAELLRCPVQITEGSPHNIKITTADDVILAEAVLSTQGVSG